MKITKDNSDLICTRDTIDGIGHPPNCPCKGTRKLPKKEIKDELKSRFNIHGLHFLIWFIFLIIVAKTPMSGDLIYWKVTWLFICVLGFSIWGYLWDKESNKKLKELEGK